MNLHFVMLELCARPEFQIALRQEMNKNAPLDYRRLEQLPLLDSFIKETVRLHPLDTCKVSQRIICNPLETNSNPPILVAIRRKALGPYTFTHGSLSIPQGATVCVSASDLMHNEEIYANPNSFDPTRHLPKDEDKTQQKFTEVSEHFPVWGYGSLACPGRQHASLVIKMILSELLLRYDLSLEDPSARTRWSWETFTMPYESTRIVLKERC